jgi:tetratricopeptide (TPR) repeat protein
MSGNNFTPDANIPMAWVLNDAGIPIAVAVEPAPQNRYTDAYTVPYAIPVAQPINNIEAPIAMPIAVPVEPTVQSIQINELERANIQMAERAQAQERALREEKIKQQKQQQELQKQQQDLKKAQQQLKDAQRIQELENQFNLTQMRLIEEYTSKINLAAEYRQLGNFDKAMQQFDLAIDSIKKLIDAYKNKEHSKGNWFVATPLIYDTYIQQARLEIVNCLMSKGAFEQAYDTLSDLRYSSNSHILNAKMKECRDVIYKKAQDLISEVRNMPTRGNAQQIATAQHLLKNAEQLLTKIGQATDSDLGTQKMRVEWDSVRDRINGDCRELLTTTFTLEYYETAAQRARGVVAEYAYYVNLLDSQELVYQAEIVNMLPGLEQVATQLRIDALTKKIEEYFSLGDIPSAYVVMHEIYNLALQIKNPHHLEHKGLIYQHPQSYYLHLQNLESEVQQFRLRAKQKHSAIVDKIIEATLSKLSEKTPNASLLEKDLKDLRNKLSSLIQDKWCQFDRRPTPNDLINNVAEQIASGCGPIGFFKKWYHWTYATSCLNDTHKTLAAIEQQICGYVATTNPEIVMSLNNAIRVRPHP